MTPEQAITQLRHVGGNDNVYATIIESLLAKVKAANDELSRIKRDNEFEAWAGRCQRERDAAKAEAARARADVWAEIDSFLTGLDGCGCDQCRARRKCLSDMEALRKRAIEPARETGDGEKDKRTSDLSAQLEAAKEAHGEQERYLREADALVAQARDDALVEAAKYVLSQRGKITMGVVHGNSVHDVALGEIAKNINALRTRSCDAKPAENATQTPLCEPDTQQEPAQVTVQEAAKVLAGLAERRALPFYVVEMPLTASGDGPATVGFDAAKISYEVWNAIDMTTLSIHGRLSDAILAALRAIAGGRT